MIQSAFALVAPEPRPVSWRVEENKAHPRLLALADQHYTRQQPGTPQFCRPGKNLCLLTTDGLAGWVTWRPIPEVGRMDNLEAWECTLFANRGPRLSSELVAEATALTFKEWGWPPRDGFITAVGIEATSRRRSKASPPGKCYLVRDGSLTSDSSMTTAPARTFATGKRGFARRILARRQNSRFAKMQQNGILRAGTTT